MSQLTNYVKLVIAKIKGDEAEAIGIKNQRKAISYLTAQIANKEAVKISLEDDVEQAEENLKSCLINNGELIEGHDSYISSLLTARRTLKLAEEALQKHVEDIEFLQDSLELAKQ